MLAFVAALFIGCSPSDEGDEGGDAAMAEQTLA